MARHAAQPDFFPEMTKQALAGFGGGSTARSNPTQARPFARNTPIHLVLRSEKARGKHSFLRFDREIEGVLRGEAARVGATLMQASNAGNHLHLLVRFPSPKAQARFLRAVSGLIARLVMGARKGRQVLAAGEKFWAGRPFSRIVGWATRTLANIRRYVTLNAQEFLYKGDSQARRHKARQALRNLEELGLVSFSAGPPRIAKT